MQARALLITRRRSAGKVRRTHGDLHLRNICLFEGEVIAFDAIEFDECLATTDVLYDLAFLVMDLRHVGLKVHANAAVNRYWDESNEDEEALALLPFFMALRAAVRMSVALEAGEAEAAEDYLRLGMGLLETHARPVVAIGGLSGSGKSTLARALAPHMPGPAGARILRTDVLRKRLLDVAATSYAGAQAYTSAAREETYRHLIQKGLEAESGASVILDATFQSAASRRLALVAFGERLHRYWLCASRSTRLARVASRADDVSDADVAVAAKQHEPAILEPGLRQLDADKPLTENVAAICSDLGLPQ